MSTEAEKRAVAKYQKGLDSIMVRTTKDFGGEIRLAALMAGQSVQAWMIQAARERIDRERGGG